ncbi:MAG: cytotoxic translational repressor of toxin-antitoxin stability system [Thermodesulfobacteriota bacterium]
MTWTVRIPKRVAKQAHRLPPAALDAVARLVADLELDGPAQPSWPNYGKIAGKPHCHHCHIRKGRPTYVVVWRIVAEGTLEVCYVGTHEGADYGRLC